MLPELDLGGGYGIPYVAGDDTPDMKLIADALREIVATVCQGKGLPVPRLTVEPGRSIVGTAGVTLYEVGTVKDVEGLRTYVSVDGGMSDNVRTALYGADYTARLASRESVAGADAVAPGRQALRERRHRGPRPLPPRRPGARRPDRGGRHRCLLPVAGQQLQLSAQAGGGRGRGRQRSGHRGARDRRRPAQGAAVSKPVKVALLGCGVVGSQVARLLQEQADDLAARVGAPLELAGVAVRKMSRKREVDLDPALLTTDAHALVTRPDVDIVVEVIGGIEPARGLILAAMAEGKSIVSANKALLAEDGATLHAANQADLYFEAAVAGAIPLIRPLRESMAGDRVHRVLGIVNGTTNYILDKMDSTGASFTDALEEAQSLGYAEADPTADIEGFDAAAKAAILAGIAFHSRVTAADVHREGITEVSASDVASAKAMGYVIKLLAICARSDDGRTFGVRVHPADDPPHPPAGRGPRGLQRRVRRGRVGGPAHVLRRGRRVARRPPPPCWATSSRSRATASPGRAAPPSRCTPTCRSTPWARPCTRYHVSLDVADKPGVLATVAEMFSRHDVSIQTVLQEGRGDDAQLVLVTHRASDAALSATVEGLRELDIVRAVASVMRVEGDETP